MAKVPTVPTAKAVTTANRAARLLMEFLDKWTLLDCDGGGYRLSLVKAETTRPIVRSTFSTCKVIVEGVRGFLHLTNTWV